VFQLAIAQLDEAQAVQSLKREKLRADEYRMELERCYARLLTLGLDPCAATTSDKGLGFDGPPSLTGLSRKGER
jgi:cob(I)alamin adenosyltransferase